MSKILRPMRRDTDSHRNTPRSSRRVVHLGVKAVLLAYLIWADLGVLQAAGYRSRSCGMDIDRDGNVGGPGDCDICDATSGTGPVAVDYDADGTTEAEIYVDADSGSNGTACGGPSNPCATLDYAVDNRRNTQVGEDAICLKGTDFITSSISLAAGDTGSYGAALYPTDETTWGTGRNQDFRYPLNPNMIVGWDTDNDGKYPPYDTDDTAIVDADQGGGSYARNCFGAIPDYFEMAHLTVKNCGRSGGGNVSSMVDTDYAYLHDIEFDSVNRGVQLSSGNIAFNMFNGDGSSWVAFVNLKMQDQGGYGWRGSCASCNDLRFDYITYTGYGTNADPQPGITFYRGWDTMTRVSLSYNDLDAQPSLWSGSGQMETVGIATSLCVQDLVARGNTTKNFLMHYKVRLTWAGGECNSRPVNNLIIDGNKLIQEHSPWINDYFFFAEEGNEAGTYLKNMTFSNNWMETSVQIEGGLVAWGGNDSTDFSGTYNVVNNVFYGDADQGAFWFKNMGANNANVVFKNNIVDGMGSANSNLRWDYTDATLTADYNVYETNALYNNSHSTLSAWRSATGQDSHSKECAPAWVNAPLDLHLRSTDTCARDQGTSVSTITNIDIDGEPRPQGAGWDIGADEDVASSSNNAPIATISTPSSGSAFPAGSATNLVGTASDPEDGDLTANLTWTSSLDGLIGSGGSISVVLSVGNHSITAKVTDSGGLTRSDSINVSVFSNSAPTVNILSPSENPALGQPVTSSGTEFQGAQASKLVDGAVEAPYSAWAAVGSPNWVEVDLGQARTLQGITVNPFIGSPGRTYYYDSGWKVQYRDKHGELRDFSQVRKLHGAGTLTDPGISITNGDPGTGVSDDDYKSYGFSFDPISVRYLRFSVTHGDVGGDSNGAELQVHEVFVSGTPINFEGSAIDVEEGELAHRLNWTSDLDGDLGRGNTLTTRSLSIGTHTVTAEVIDSGGRRGRDTLSVQVIAAPYLIFSDSFETGDSSRWLM